MAPTLPITALVAGSGFFLLDQWSKQFAQVHLAHRVISCEPAFRLRRVAHRKDFFQSGKARTWMSLVWLTALVSAISLYRLGGWFHHPLGPIGVALALAGAAGNLVDILRWRYVVDFVDLGWWPVFNLADVGIVGGLLLAFGSGL